jgi:catechol 2,3-dioxygenase-like lactoylglutathione lyase family enzyme
VNARHLDHLTLRIPDDGEDAARAFYGETLGFPIFDVRLSPTAVVHLRPTAAFDPPSDASYDHLCVVVEESLEAIERELERADADVERTLDAPVGATGRAGAVYVRDPFGYRVELKTLA